MAGAGGGEAVNATVHEVHPLSLSASEIWFAIFGRLKKRTHRTGRDSVPLIVLDHSNADMPRAIKMVYDKGIRDTTGEALCLAISERRGKCVQALLECTATESCVREYINKARLDGLGWLSHSLHGRRPSVKVVRLLVDAGADTTSTIGVQWGTQPPFESTPTECLVMALEADSAEPVVEEAHLGALKGILRLLRQVPAVHATSWLWPKSSCGKGKRVEKSTAIAGMLPLLKRRVTKRHVLLGALAR